METITYYFINKPNFISINRWSETHNYYEALQWYAKEYSKGKHLIGVWHIKYKDIDCNFS